MSGATFFSWSCVTIQEEHMHQNTATEWYIYARIPLDHSRFPLMHQLDTFPGCKQQKFRITLRRHQFQLQFSNRVDLALVKFSSSQTREFYLMLSF